MLILSSSLADSKLTQIIRLDLIRSSGGFIKCISVHTFTETSRTQHFHLQYAIFLLQAFLKWKQRM